MATTADPTIEFMQQFADESKWIIKRRIPLFKPHDRMKVIDGKQVVAYSVTRNDMPQIAANGRRNQEKGIPARMTVGHVKGNPDEPESEQPRVVGYWLNPQPGTFGPDNEPCVYYDSYVKRDCAADVKGRPYRSAEYYPGAKEIRGAALLTRDPQLDLGTVELYRVPEGAYLYAAPGEFYMADDDTKPTPIGMKQSAEEPEGHKGWCAHMEHYAKGQPWVGHAMQLYAGAGMPSATDTTIPATPAKKPDDDVQRMQRDDEAVNYARLSAQITELEKAREVDRAVIANLTKERDQEQCERMVRTLQAEGYQLKDDTPTLVGKLLKKSAEDRTEMVQMIRDYSPKGAPTGPMLELYSGHVEDDPAKAKPAALSPKQIGEIAKRHAGNMDAFNKEVDALQNGTAVKN